MRWWSRALLAWLILLLASGAALRAYIPSVASGGAHYQTADWLISYAGGFVRRGFFGWVYLTSFPAGQAGLWLLFAVQLLLYAVPLAYAIWWLHRSDYDWLAIALVCGPAAMAFVGWDPAAFGRKESLAFTALTLLAIAGHPARRPGPRRAFTIAALLLFTTAVWSWEANALLLPGVVYVLHVVLRPGLRRWEWRSYAAFAVGAAALGLSLSVLFPGDRATGAAVCAAARSKGLASATLCDGAISFLGWTGPQMWQTVRRSFPTYLSYVPVIVLGALPVLSTPWVRERWRWALACAAAIAPLFLVATDYGRWTAMLVVELVICLMATPGTPGRSRQWTPVAALLYVTTWGIPHWLPPDATAWPWLGAAREVVRFAIQHVPGL